MHVGVVPGTCTVSDSTRSLSTVELTSVEQASYRRPQGLAVLVAVHRR